MDIRRLKLFNSRNAALLTNDLVQLVVEDQGGMVLEFSAKIANGGRINPHAIPSHRGTGSSVYSDENGEFWQINPDIRAMVQHKQLNLLHDFSHLGIFDVIFCRNVLIYFDQPTKIDILSRIARTMTSDGYLVLGAAETVVGLSDSFKPMPEKRGLYLPVTAGSGSAATPSTSRLSAAGMAWLSGRAI